MAVNYDECGIVAATGYGATIGVPENNSTFQRKGRHGWLAATSSRSPLYKILDACRYGVCISVSVVKSHFPDSGTTRQKRTSDNFIRINHYVISGRRSRSRPAIRCRIIILLVRVVAVLSDLEDRNGEDSPGNNVDSVVLMRIFEQRDFLT